MKSGIYQLTFPDQYVYIGQAVDIQRRWEQHRKDFLSGQHTKKMQAIYNEYGWYEEKVLVHCHPDYLDALEANAIYLFKQTDCTLLNTSIPKKDSPAVDTFCKEALEIPAVELLQYNPHHLEAMISELEGELNKYHRVSSTRKAKEYTEELQRENVNLSRMYQAAHKKQRELETTIASYNERSWLYRLLNKVSV